MRHEWFLWMMFTPARCSARMVASGARFMVQQGLKVTCIGKRIVCRMIAPVQAFMPMMTINPACANPCRCDVEDCDITGHA
jgi:hypothetical protein